MARSFAESTFLIHLYFRYALAFAWFAMSNFLLLMVASIVTVYIAPAAAGSGIPEVKAYLNGVDAPDIFSVKTLLVKVLPLFIILFLLYEFRMVK